LFRGDEDGFEIGSRTRRPKSMTLLCSFYHILANFSEDFVYDDIVMRNSMNQKSIKELQTAATAAQ